MTEFQTDIDVLLECVKCQQDNSQTLCQSLITLSNVIIDGKTKDYFRESGGLKYVYNVLLRTNKNEVKIATLFCLASAVEKSVFSQNLLTQQSVFCVMHSILQSRETSSSKLHQAAVYFLLCLVADNSQAQNQARETGCLADLIDKLRTYVSNVHCLEEDSRELGLVTSALSVCVNNPQNDENQRLCSPLLPHVFNVVRQITSSQILSPLLSFVGLMVANNVFNQDRVRKCGGLNILISCLCSLTKKKEEESLTTAVQVVGTLDYCLTENVSNIRVFREVCGAGPLFSLLSPGLLNQQEQLQVIITLSHVLTTSPDEVCTLTAHHYKILVGLLTQADDEELIKALKYVLHMCKNSDDQLQSEDKKNVKSNLGQSNQLILCKIDELAAKLDTFQDESRHSISPMDQNNSCNVPVNESLTDFQNEQQPKIEKQHHIGNEESGNQFKDIQPAQNKSNTSEEAAPILMNWLKQLIPQFLRREANYIPSMLNPNSLRDNLPYDYARNSDYISSPRPNHDWRMNTPVMPHFQNEMPASSYRYRSSNDHPESYQNWHVDQSGRERREISRMDSSHQWNLQPQGTPMHQSNPVPASPCTVFDYKHGHRIEEKAYRMNCAETNQAQNDICCAQYQGSLHNASLHNQQRHSPSCQTATDHNNVSLQNRNCSSHLNSSQFQAGEKLISSDSSCRKCGDDSANTSDNNISMLECNRNNNSCVNECTSGIHEISIEGDKIHKHDGNKENSIGTTEAQTQMPRKQCEVVKKTPSAKRSLSTERRRQSLSSMKPAHSIQKPQPPEQTPETSKSVSNMFKTPAPPCDGSFLRPTDVPIRRKIRTPSSCGSSISSLGSRHNVRILARKSVIGIQPYPISSPSPQRITRTPTTPLPSPACSEFDMSLLKSAGRREKVQIYGLLTPSVKRQEPGLSRCWTDVRTLQPNFSAGRQQIMSDTDSEFSPTTSDDFTNSQEGTEEENPIDNREQSDLCPGCHAPGALNRPLLNSRTYNISLETSTGTCKQHRSLRCSERQFILKHKSHQPIPKSRPLPELNNRSIGSSCPPSRGLSVYEFYPSSGSSEQKMRKCVSPPVASTYLNKSHNIIHQIGRRRKIRKRSRAVYSEEEITNLLHGVEKFGTKWSQILVTYSFHPSRTAVDLKEKHARLMKKDKETKKRRKRGPVFSMCEERRLRRGVRTLGYNWRGILNMFQFAKDRTAEELRLKWRTMNRKCAETDYMKSEA